MFEFRILFVLGGGFTVQYSTVIVSQLLLLY